MFAFGDEKWPGLSKLVEECGEVLQVAGKLIQTRGAVEHWDGSDLRGRLTCELADLAAALQFFAELNRLDTQTFKDRVAAKLELFRGWHNDGDNLPPDRIAPHHSGCSQ